MSIAAIQWAWTCHGCSPGAKLLLLALADHCHGTNGGECWPSMARLAEMTGLSKASICRHLAELEQRGHICRVRSNGYTSTVYRLQTTPPEASERESDACAEVARLAQVLAMTAAPLARVGDGNCGEVIRTVLEALSAQGLYVDPQTNRPPVKKAFIPQGLRKQVFERDAYRCVRCHTHVDLCVDHIQPESKGGTLEMANLQTLCRSCNSAKGARE